MITSPHTGRILLIEADTGERLIVTSRLTDVGHAVTAVESGAQGIAVAREEPFDLIVVSAELAKGIDGLEVCRRLRTVPSTAQVPTVVYSTRNTPAELPSKCYEAGADVWLGKSQMSSLEHVLRVLLRQKAQCDDLAEHGRVLEQRNRTLQSQLDSAAAQRKTGSAPAFTGEPAAGRPDGVLVVDTSGQIVRHDRGAREVLGCELIGRRLGSLAPNTGLEAFVRDARGGPREGFRFDVAARSEAPGRSLLASVVPLPSARPDEASGQRVVLLLDVGRRRVATEAARRSQSGLPPGQLDALLEAARTLYRPEAIPGDSEAGRVLRERIGELAGQNTAVLLLGEPGTRKDFLARVLHHTSRESGPFLEISCAGLSEKNLELELFGETTGKKSERRPGLLDQARGGTLLLREIAAIPRPLQERLVEIVEASGRARRRSRAAAPARIVATSEQKVEELAAEGLFSEELLARLSAGSVAVPALRDRPEDLPLIVRRALERLGKGACAHDVDEDALELLAVQQWAENERELEEVLELACRQATGSFLRRVDLPAHLMDALEGERAEHGLIPAMAPAGEKSAASLRPLGTNGRAARSDEGPGGRPWDITDEDPIDLEVYEMKALMRALDTCGGDKQAAARLLELGKSTFYRKLKRYGIR